MKTLIIFLSLFISLSCFADSFYVYPVKARRVDKEMGATISDLIESSISEDDHQVTQEKSQAQYLIKATISRLGGTYTVSLRLIKGKKVKYSGKLKSSGEDELDTVVSRLVKSALSGRSSGTTPAIGQITDKEVTAVSRRTESRHYTYFALGPFGLSKLETPGVGYYLAYGHIWEVSPNAAIKLTGEGTFLSSDNTASLIAVSGGANYYFSADSTSLFIGGDLGYGAAATSHNNIDSTGGFALGASVGVVFFRTSATQMSITGRIQGVASDNKIGSPYHGGLALGFHY